MEGLLRPSLPRPAHQCQQAGAEMPAWHGVERGVDGLVTELYRVGHTTECALNLRRTQALAKRIDHHAPERVAGDQLAQASRLVGQQTSAPVGSHTAITSGNSGSASRGHFSIRLPAITPYLAGDGGTGSHQSCSNHRWLHVKPQLSLNQCPFLNFKVTVTFRHMQLSPIGDLLHLYLESAVPHPSLFSGEGWESETARSPRRWPPAWTACPEFVEGASPAPQVPYRLFFPENPPTMLYPTLPDLGVCRSTLILRF